MDCIYCDSKTVKIVTTYRSKLHDYKLKLKDIPAYQCTRCKAVYYDVDIVIQIQSITESFYKAPASERPDLISYEKSLTYVNEQKKGVCSQSAFVCERNPTTYKA